MRILWTILIATFSMTGFASSNDYVEEVIVVGAYVTDGYGDPEYDNNLLESIQPTKQYNAGGLGAFQGIQLSGTDTKHTAVFKNGVPINDPSSGWYDFGTDLLTGQNLTVIHGPGSVKFGSSSMAGTVIINDDLQQRQTVIRGASDQVSVFTAVEGFQVAHYKGSNGSVRSDNDEADWYENTTVKTGYDFENWRVRADFTDYKYDYDNCYMPDWSVSNDCFQDGEKTFFSVQHERFVLGYNKNKAEHNTGFVNDSERYYTNAVLYNDYGFEVGVTGQRETYNELERDSGAGYIRWYNDLGIGVGYRYEDDEHIARIGYDGHGFRLSLGNSFRRPNLYEENGDQWVAANPDLQPEKGVGAEFGYGFLSVYYYDFSEGIDFDMTDYKYVNTGKYTSQGVKFQRQWLRENGSWFTYFEYTDSDKIRVPEYMAKLSYYQSGYMFGYLIWDTEIAYIGEFNKGNDFDGRPIDDVSSFDWKFGIYPKDDVHIIFRIQDILDNEFEFLPDYNAGGRQFSMSVRLTY